MRHERRQHGRRARQSGWIPWDRQTHTIHIVPDDGPILVPARSASAADDGVAQEEGEILVVVGPGVAAEVGIGAGQGDVGGCGFGPLGGHLGGEGGGDVGGCVDGAGGEEAAVGGDGGGGCVLGEQIDADRVRPFQRPGRAELTDVLEDGILVCVGGLDVLGCVPWVEDGRVQGIEYCAAAVADLVRKAVDDDEGFWDVAKRVVEHGVGGRDGVIVRSRCWGGLNRLADVVLPDEGGIVRGTPGGRVDIQSEVFSIVLALGGLREKVVAYGEFVVGATCPGQEEWFALGRRYCDGEEAEIERQSGIAANVGHETQIIGVALDAASFGA